MCDATIWAGNSSSLVCTNRSLAARTAANPAQSSPVQSSSFPIHRAHPDRSRAKTSRLNGEGISHHHSTHMHTHTHMHPHAPTCTHRHASRTLYKKTTFLQFICISARLSSQLAFQQPTPVIYKYLCMIISHPARTGSTTFIPTPHLFNVFHHISLFPFPHQP